MAVRILPAARARLIDIWGYTETKWGEEQADKYVRGLIDAANKLPTTSQIWRPVRNHALEGVFYVRYRHHYIFFRRLQRGNLGVLSILHENMDIPSRLKDDVTSKD